MAIIDDPSAYFQTTLYTGNGGTNAITNTGNSDLQPDWIWFKRRDGADNHIVFDVVRGVTKAIYPDLDNLEDTLSNSLSSFNSDGFTLGADTASGGSINGSSETCVAWQWKAGTSVSGTTTGSGTGKAYTGSVNTDAGFSIIRYLGNSSAGHTIPHNLGAVPKMIIGHGLTGSDTTSWTKLSSIPTDDPDITSPNICDKSCIEAFASGINPFRDGANPLIIDIQGLNVTTTSPNSETVLNLNFTCSMDSFAPPTMFFIFLT